MFPLVRFHVFPNLIICVYRIARTHYVVTSYLLQQGFHVSPHGVSCFPLVGSRAPSPWSHPVVARLAHFLSRFNRSLLYSVQTVIENVGRDEMWSTSQSLPLALFSHLVSAVGRIPQDLQRRSLCC